MKIANHIMKITKKIIVLFSLSFTLLITSCSKTTNLNGTWKNIDYSIKGYENINLRNSPDIIIKNNNISIDGGDTYHEFKYDNTEDQTEWYPIQDLTPVFCYDKDSKKLYYCTFIEIEDEYAIACGTYIKR